MNHPRAVYSVDPRWLITERHLCSRRVGVVIDPGRLQGRAPENQLLYGGRERQAGLLFHDKREKVVSGMFLVQIFRSRLEQQRLAFDFGNQRRGRLTLLKNVVVVGQVVDVRQAGTLGEQVAHGDFFRAFASGNEFANARIEAQLAFVDQPQNRRRGELHRNGRDVEPRFHRIRNFALAVREAVGFFKNSFPIHFRENRAAEVPALHVRLKIGINPLGHTAFLRPRLEGANRKTQRD